MRIREFFAARPRMATVLHVVLAVLPVLFMAMLLLGFIYVFVYPGAVVGDDFNLVAKFLIGTGGCGFIVGIPCWILSLLLYRFTAAVREAWSDRLRMALIRLNILGAFLAIIEVFMIIMLLIED